MAVTSAKSQTFAKAMFIYGCLTTALALYIYVSFAIMRLPDVPELLTRLGLELSCIILGAHMLTFVATFDREATGEWTSRWDPVIRPTKRSVLIGKTIVFASACNFFIWFPYFMVMGDPWAFAYAQAALFLFSTAYTAVHWALRPENLFPARVPRFVRDTLGFLTGPLLKPVLEWRIARRPTMPFDEWLPEFLQCCEIAVGSTRLVNSESPGVGEVDCLEFQVLLMVELQSRTCILRHKKRLSHDGVTAIQAFLRSVDALDHNQLDQAAWRGAVDNARSVLALRGDRALEAVKQSA